MTRISQQVLDFLHPSAFLCYWEQILCRSINDVTRLSVTKLSTTKASGLCFLEYQLVPAECFFLLELHIATHVMCSDHMVVFKSHEWSYL